MFIKVFFPRNLPLDQGGGEGKAMHFEAKGTFRMQSLTQVADGYGNRWLSSSSSRLSGTTPLYPKQKMVDKGND
ncbi:unnamed protein product [Victoria cruziana]